MGLQTAPAYIGDPGFDHPVELDRNIMEGIFGRTGRMRSGDLTFAKVVGSLQATLGAGRAFLLGTETAKQGGYVVWSEATQTIAWPSPSGSPRIDTFLVRVRDNQYGTVGGALGADWDIISGTPGSSPIAVADVEFNTGGDFYEPGAWWRVADVRVNPGMTELDNALITQYQTYTRHSTARILCTSAARPTDVTAGDLIYETDTGLEWKWNGSKWLSAGAVFVRKTADESVVSSTTLQSDNHLFFPVDANSVYHVTGNLLMKVGGSTPDVKFTWQMPTLATATGQFQGAGQDHISSDGSPAVGATSGAGPVPHAVDYTIVTGANAGTVTLRWAQNVSDPGASIIATDSYIEWKKVG